MLCTLLGEEGRKHLSRQYPVPSTLLENVCFSVSPALRILSQADLKFRACQHGQYDMTLVQKARKRSEKLLGG